MSTLTRILFLLFFSSACFLNASQLPILHSYDGINETALQKSRTVELNVTGMTCQKGCADGIDKKLKKTEGIIKSKTKLSTGICKVTFDESQISLDQIIAVIDKLGYKAKPNS